MANVTGASLQPIYERLNSAPRYHPMEADTFADPCMEAGDMVEVTRGESSYESPVHSTRLVWKKGTNIEISTGGKEKRDSVAKVSNRKYRAGSTGLRSERYIHLYVDSQYDQMRSGLELTGSAASLYVRDLYSQMRAGLDLTSSSAALYVDNKYLQMRAGLDLTSSSAALYVNNKYLQMKAGLDLTSSSAALYVNNKYLQMKAGLDLTSSSAALYVDNKYLQMKAGLDLTSSSAALYVNNKYLQMNAGLDMTASSLSAFVSNAYTRLKTGLSLSTHTAILYARSAENAAQIIAHVNDSSSNITLKADRIMLNGTTSIANVLSVLNSGDVTITGDVYSTGTFHPNGISMAAGSSLSFAFGTAPPVTYTLNSSNVPTMIVKAELISNGSSLRLTQLDGNYVDFSKAITLNGAWSDGNTGVFTFSASNQSRVTTITGVSLNGSATLNNNNKKQMNVPLKVEASVDSGEPETVYTQGAIPVNCTPVWNEGYDQARRYVIWPDAPQSGVEVTTFDVYVPNSSRDGTERHIFRLSKGTPSASGGYVGISLDGTAVGRIDITNWYNAGYNDNDTATLDQTNTTLGYGQSITVTAQYYDIGGTLHNTTNTCTITAPGAGTLSGSWSGEKYTVALSSTSEKKTIGFSGDVDVGLSIQQQAGQSATVVGSSNYLSVPIEVISAETISGTTVTGTRHTQTLTVNAADMRNAGKMDVSITTPEWTYDGDTVDNNNLSSNTLTVSTSGRPTEITKTSTIRIATGQWSNNEMVVYVRKGASGGQYICKTTISCASEVSGARTAGQMDVGLGNPAWTYDGDTVDANAYNTNTVSVQTTGRPTAITQSATIYLNIPSEWSNGSKTIYVQKNNSSGEHIAIGTVSVPSATWSWDNNNASVSSDWTPTGRTLSCTYGGHVESIWLVINIGTWNTNNNSVPVYVKEGSWSGSSKLVYTVDAQPRWNAGWDAARDYATWPTSTNTSTSYMTVTKPNAERTGADSMIFSISQSSDLAYANLTKPNAAGTGTITVARLTLTHPAATHTPRIDQETWVGPLSGSDSSVISNAYGGITVHNSKTGGITANGWYGFAVTCNGANGYYYYTRVNVQPTVDTPIICGASDHTAKSSPQKPQSAMSIRASVQVNGTWYDSTAISIIPVIAYNKQVTVRTSSWTPPTGSRQLGLAAGITISAAAKYLTFEYCDTTYYIMLNTY